MCLAVLSLQPDSDWQWVIVANRDEAHERPSADMHPWQQEPSILAGRDLRAGGSWLGIRSDGRFALLTNYREPGRQRADAPSRGHLVEQFLCGPGNATDYLETLAGSASQYNGFNLLLGQGTQWFHASNRADVWSRRVTAGTYGLSNALFDTPWPKVMRTRQAVEQRMRETCTTHELSGQSSDPLSTQLYGDLPDLLSDIFSDKNPAPDSALPETGVGLERERMLSSPFIVSPTYGTRCTTVVMQHRDGHLLAQETTYFPDGTERSKSRWSTQLPGYHSDEQSSGDRGSACHVDPGHGNITSNSPWSRLI